MADSFIQLPADSTGKQLDTALVNMGAGTTAVHREKVVLSDPASTTGFATVTSSAGLLASLSSGTVSLSSQITVTATGPVTITSGTVTLSSVPTVFSASSGGIQAFIPISPTSSVAGAGFGPVTSSAGVLASLSSGTVSLSSQISVTATAATNPWSSAPGFNVPIVSVSSGLVQISGTPTILSASSGLVQISGTPLVNVVGTSSAIATVTSSGGLSVSIVAGAVGSTSVNIMGTQNVIVVTVTSGAFASGLYVFSTAGGAGSTSVNVLGSGAFAPVTSSAGILASLSSGTVSLSSQISVTATAGTNPWSSAPGFNIPVVNVSSGLLQAFQVGTWTLQTTAGTAINTSSAIGVPVFYAITPTSSVAGAAIAPVTSSGGLLASLSSGTITLSSQISVTSTAATNPWSSAPGFNLPIVSVSSGLVQISGVPLIAVTSSAMSLLTIGTTAPAPVLVTSSGGPVVSLGVNTAAGYGPVTSSFGQLVNQTTLSIPSVINASSANPTPIVWASSGALSTANLLTEIWITTGDTRVKNVKGSAGTIFGYSLFNSTASLRSVKIFNATSAPTAGSTATYIMMLLVPGSTGGGGANVNFSPYGVYCSAGIGYAITANAAATDTGAPGANDVTLNLYYV